MGSINKAYYSQAAIAQIEAARTAIKAKDYLALSSMLSQGLNPNIPSADGRYLVHDAILHDADGTAIDILAHYRADLNARWKAYLDWTPAHIAWFMRRADIVDKLKGLGANLGLEDTRGWSALRALPCPITRKEAERKFDHFASAIHRGTTSHLFTS